MALSFFGMTLIRNKNRQEPDWHKDLMAQFNQVKGNILLSGKDLNARVSELSARVEETLRSCKCKLTNDTLPFATNRLQPEKSQTEVELSNQFGQVENIVRLSAKDLDDKMSVMVAKFEELTTLRSCQYKLANDELSLSIGRLQHEKAQVESERDSWQQAFAEKESELAKVTNDLAAANGLLAVKEQEFGERIKQLEDELQTAKDALAATETAHHEEVTRLSQEWDQKIDELTKKHADDLTLQKEQSERQLEAVRRSIDEFVPPQVCALFNYRIGDLSEDRSRWQAIYAYLGLVNGNLRPNVFAKRFREFDAALYDAMSDSQEDLAECRARVENHINETISPKIGGLQIHWPREGEAYNSDCYKTTSSSGQRVTKAIYAMVYKKDADGRILCQTKGEVETI